MNILNDRFSPPLNKSHVSVLALAAAKKSNISNKSAVTVTESSFKTPEGASVTHTKSQMQHLTRDFKLADKKEFRRTKLSS